MTLLIYKYIKKKFNIYFVQELQKKMQINKLLSKNKKIFCFHWGIQFL
jgi:hypothetical protein